MSENRYFVSIINIETRRQDYFEKSFEVITDETYQKILKLKNKEIYLGEVLGENSCVFVKLDDDEWCIKEITKKSEISTFKKLDYLLPTFNRIRICVENSEEELK